MSKFTATAAIFLGILPNLTSAQIVINEFLYDAQGSDTDQEYVELLNTASEAVDLSKWKINDGSNHTLNVPPKNGGAGSIIIPAGGIILLVDNASNFIAVHSGITVSIIDTVLSLNNTVGTISLIDEVGALADSISYTKDLGAAGDGNSLHRTTPSATNFSPGSPTPGDQTAGSPPAQDSGTSNDTSTASSTTTMEESQPPPPPPSSGGTVSSAGSPIEPKIFAYAGKNREVIAGADTLFEARAFDKKNNSIQVGRFLWTFGDGSSAEGRTVMHHFPQPGRYAVVLDIADDFYTAAHQIVVTALPVSITLSVKDGDIILTNKSGKDLDLSYWNLRSGGEFFSLPKHTILLGNAIVPFTSEVTNIVAQNDAVLLYPNGVVAANVGSIPLSPPPPSTFSKQASPPISALVETNTIRSEAEDDTSFGSEATTTGQTASVGATLFSSESLPWWGGAVTICVLSGAAVYVVRHVRKHEWDIVEETSKEV